MANFEKHSYRNKVMPVKSKIILVDDCFVKNVAILRYMYTPPSSNLGCNCRSENFTHMDKKYDGFLINLTKPVYLIEKNSG